MRKSLYGEETEEILDKINLIKYNVVKHKTNTNYKRTGGTYHGIL